MDDKPRVGPKDFFLWAGATIALYGAVTAFISLIFSYLNYVYPDQLRYYTSDPYMGGVSYEMASLIVLSVLYSILSRAIVRDVARDPSRLQIWVRRWAIYLTLFIMSATITIDLITLIMYFLNGDVTLRFILKVIVVLLIAGGVFLHHLVDLHAYWTREVPKARIVRLASFVLVLATLAAGFFIIGTPWHARLSRFDEQRINDLQQLQSQILTYYERTGALPQKLENLQDPLSGFALPVDPKTGNRYEYEIMPKDTWTNNEPTFELCSDFSTVNLDSNATQPTRPTPLPGFAGKDIWPHNAVRTCFLRPIDPALYPEFAKPAPAPIH